MALNGSVAGKRKTTKRTSSATHRKYACRMPRRHHRLSHEATPSPATSAHSSARPHVHTPSPRLCLSSAPPRPEPKITFRNYQPRDDDLKDQQLEPTLAVVVATDKDAAKEEKTAELEAAEVRRDV